MNNRLIILIIVIAVIVGAIFVLTNPFKKEESPFIPQAGQTQNTKTSEVGQEVLDFELESFEGEKVRLSQFRGKSLFIDFWAAWCPFCINEMPEIEKIHKEFGDQLVVLGIHRSETEKIEQGAKFAKERGVTYTLLKDSSGGVYRVLTGGRNFMPYALYIDKDGNIVKTKAGPKTAEEMKQAIEELLK